MLQHTILPLQIQQTSQQHCLLPQRFHMLSPKLRWPATLKMHSKVIGLSLDKPHPDNVTWKRFHGTPSPQHKSTSSQRVVSTAPAHILCRQPFLSRWHLLGFGETHRNPAVYFRVVRVSTVVFTENNDTEFAQEEKEDMTSLIHVCLGFIYFDVCWCADAINSSSRRAQSFVNKEIISP